MREQVKVLILSPNEQLNAAGLGFLRRLAANPKAVRDFDDSLLVSRLVELANSQDPHAALGTLLRSAFNLA